MDSGKDYQTILWIIIFVAGVLIWRDRININELKEKNVYLNDRVSSYESALSEANDNIEQANSNIEDAQSNAWGNYQDMGDALDSLGTVNTVNEP